jgi:HTH-type transcriptional regulator, transcriptional repressor of NAD biosynthesis genes
MTKRGLIVGKFYPPHRGHKYLIDAGLSQVDQLSVIVCQKPNETPSGELRAAWIREIHPDVTVLLIDDVYDEQDSKVWAENSIRWLGFRPDVVFTSEDYGDRFAHHLQCKHMLVDKARGAVPVSGTRVRGDPLSCWEFLEPPVRGFQDGTRDGEAIRGWMHQIFLAELMAGNHTFQLLSETIPERIAQAVRHIEKVLAAAAGPDAIDP